MALLTVCNLSVRFVRQETSFMAVDDVSFTIPEGETLALVGESGCGKTLTALALLRLLPGGARLEGSITWRERQLTTLPEKAMRGVRGKEIAMLFQDPLAALNPVFSIGGQIAEVLRCHERSSRRDAWQRAVAELHAVGLPEPECCARSYPHQLSGGMRQRAVLALAAACRPALLLADEPTTALDAITRAHIIALLRRWQSERRLAMLLISHDLGLVAELAQQVAVMYAGQIVETTATPQLFAQPRHPYTQALLACITSLANPAHQRLATIAGQPPDLTRLPGGCRFAPRCPLAQEQCHQPQVLREVTPGHWVRCCRAGERQP